MVVLKGVPTLLSPELLFTLARMGHRDEIVLAHMNFPSSSMCRGGPEEIRADSLGIPQLSEAVLQLLPLDTYVQSPAMVMELMPSDRKRGLLTPVWTSYQSILSRAGYEGSLGMVERFAFYERAKKAFAVVATGSEQSSLEWFPAPPPPLLQVMRTATVTQRAGDGRFCGNNCVRLDLDPLSCGKGRTLSEGCSQVLCGQDLEVGWGGEALLFSYKFSNLRHILNKIKVPNCFVSLLPPFKTASAMRMFSINLFTDGFCHH
ncbi:fucose mutarotase-like [Cervus elaphus]|uniref:fucose mutarotase-like n=1 Tax=Cervus canadensis TaxID=1574408 RepID=UPI001C9E9748|nr:fucose mutarotase-like [Cervus canadensis]XP_043750056.1 fucose mutarotase-like [Cervus elaphus]